MKTFCIVSCAIVCVCSAVPLQKEAAVRVDFADPDHPKTLRAYILAGNPDLAAVWKGRAVIPAGHQGLLLER